MRDLICHAACWIRSETTMFVVECGIFPGCRERYWSRVCDGSRVGGTGVILTNNSVISRQVLVIIEGALLAEIVDTESSYRAGMAIGSQKGSLTGFQITGTFSESQEGSPSTMCYTRAIEGDPSTATPITGSRRFRPPHLEGVPGFRTATPASRHRGCGQNV